MIEPPVTLIVEPSSILRRRLQDWLMGTLSGYVVIAAEDGAEAMQVMNESPADFILIELQLPDQSGLDLVRRFRKVVPNAKIFVTSMHESRPIREQALAAGADGLIPKHKLFSDLPALVNAIRRGADINVKEGNKIENALKINEQLLPQLPEEVRTHIAITSSLLKQMPDGILLEDASGHIIFANRPMLSMTEYADNELIGSHWSILTPETELGMVEDHSQKRLNKIASQYETAILTRRGSRVPVLVSATPVFEQDEFICTLVIMTDISKSKQVEAKLLESNEHFRSLWESTVEGIVIHDKGIILEVNPALLKLFGLSRNQVIGKSLVDFAPPDVQENIRKQVTSANLNSYETYFVKPDGTRLRIEIIRTNVSYEGKPVRMVSVRDITDRHEALERLRQSEERFRSVIENVSDIVTVLNANGAILYESPSVLRVLGYQPEELLEQNVFELIHADDLPNVLEVFATTFPTPGVSITIELRFRHKDGSWRFLEASGKSAVDENGQLIGIINSRDITERKAAEARTQRHLQYLTALREIDRSIESTFDMSISLNSLVAQAVSSLWVDAAALLLLDKETNTFRCAACVGFLKNEEILSSTVAFESSYASRVVKEGKLIEVQNLADAPNNNFEIGLIVSDHFSSYYGVPLIVKGETIGVLEVFSRTVMDRDQDWYDFLGALGVQTSIAVDNGLLWKKVQSHASELEQRVTERTSELNRTNVELARANRTKDEFLATMSHELRTPLNSILGLSESLLEQRRDPLSDHQHNALQAIETSGRHLLALINDILDLSKIEAGKFDIYPQVIDLNTVCRSCLGFVKAQAAKKSISLHYTDVGIGHNIYADPRRLKQILVNLLSNAVKFTHENGEVTLKIHADAEHDLVQFTVSDTGIGISHQDLQSLFEPFVQADSQLNRQYEGTGLGLALVRKLTDLHGGSVAVESEVGKGSHFTVNLPWGRQIIAQLTQSERKLSRQPSAGNPPPASTAESHQRVILLAEDNMANILTIGEYLENHKNKIIVAHDGEEAIRMAEEFHPDVILMDIEMPVMDGMEATRRLRKKPRFASTPIIVLTALALPGDRERCLEAGASEYITKPVSLKKLLQTIKSLHS